MPKTFGKRSQNNYEHNQQLKILIFLFKLRIQVCANAYNVYTQSLPLISVSLHTCRLASCWSST